MRWVVPGAFAAFGVLVVLVPLVRLYLRTGVVGLVPHRQRDPWHQTLGAGLVLMMAAIGAYAAVVGWLGPAAVGAVAAPAWLTAVGLIGMALGTGYVMVAQAQMGSSWRIGIDDRPTALVASGLYRYTRHPIYTGLLGWVWSTLLVSPSLAFVGIAAGITAIVVLQAHAEEAHLVEVHGDLYRAYAREVGQFLPRLRRRPGSG